MKSMDESSNYINNKTQIFIRLIDSIDSALLENKTKIYVKNIKILEEQVDVIAEADTWPEILKKAISFFESLEDYEMCQLCLDVLDKVKANKKNE